jgi:hypothetical protein
LHDNEVLLKEYWQEIIQLPIEKEVKMADPSFSSVAEALAEILADMKITKLKNEEIINLFCMVSDRSWPAQNNN